MAANELLNLSARLNRFRERIASATAATNMSADSQAIAIAMITTMHATLFEELANKLTMLVAENLV